MDSRPLFPRSFLVILLWVCVLIFLPVSGVSALAALNLPSGNVDIAVLAQDSPNSAILNTVMSLLISAQATPAGMSGGMAWVGAIVLALLLAGLAIFWFFQRKKRSPLSARKQDSRSAVAAEEVTFDKQAEGKSAPASLTVLFSDDPALIGHKYFLNQHVTRLGRHKTINDIAFENDPPVSREHAVISVNNQGQYVLEEATHRTAGQMVGPTYGTFVNDNKLTQAHIILNGDHIRLGNRLQLLFEATLAEQDASTNIIENMDEATQISD
jgi:hypothetical protein